MDKPSSEEGCQTLRGCIGCLAVVAVCVLIDALAFAGTLWVVRMIVGPVWL